MNNDPFLDESLDRLRRNDPTLTILNLNHVGVGISTKRCHSLAMALRHNTHLIVLFLNNNDLFGRSPAFLELAKSIGRHPSLSFLYMSYNSALGDAGATVLAQHALLLKSEKGEEEVEAAACHHRPQPPRGGGGLKVLKLAHNNIGPVGAKALAEALKLQQQQQPRRRRRHHNAATAACCFGLQSLVLEHNRLGPHGILELAHAMRYNTSLASLNVRHNHVKISDVQLVQAAFLDSLRRDNRTLSELLLALDTANDNDQSSYNSKAVGRELQYHIDWNRLGRQYFGDAAIPASAWTRVLGKAASTAITTSKSPFSGRRHQHYVKKNAPPPPLAPSLLFTTLRARPDLLQQQQEQQQS